MGFLKTILSRESRSVDPHMGWRLQWSGGGVSEAGEIVSEHTAFNTMVVMSCVKIISEAVAELPLGVYRRVEPRGRERARDRHLDRVLHDEPNPIMTSFTWRERTLAHLLLWGNAYSIIERDRGEVVALWSRHPRRMEPELIEGQLFYRDLLDGNRLYPSSDILHIPGIATDGLKGLSPLAMMREAIGVTVAAERMGARLYANDARPSVLIKHPAQLSTQAAENLKKSWRDNYGGANRGGVGVLEEGMDITTFSMSLEDAQFLETRKFQVNEFARFFRIPPHLLADVERSTSWGSGIEQQNIGFVTYTLQPWLVRIEQEMNRKLLLPNERSTYYVQFNVDGLLRGDVASRNQAYATGRQWGWLSANDIRELENQNPVDGGDTYLQPLNMVPAGSDPFTPDDDGEDRSATAEWRSTLESRTARSATNRRRIANAHITTYRDMLQRVIKLERQEVSKRIRQHMRQRDANNLFDSVKDWYFSEFPEKFERHATPTARTLFDAVSISVADEMGGDPVPDADMDDWTRSFVETWAKRHAGDSRARLLSIINDHSQRQDDDLIDDLEEEIDTWDSRVDIEAHDESHRGMNATSKWAYGLAGVFVYRWVSAGSDPCEFCKGLDGRTIGNDGAFVPAGQEFSPSGINAFISQYSIGHPPLHTGCECIVAPG